MNTEKINKLKEEIASLEKEDKEYNALSVEQKVAEELHKKLCHWNHTDGCSWFYESWDKPSLNSTHGEYLKKAKNCLKITNSDVIINILKCI